VRDKEQFEFKPSLVVSSICKVYKNLNKEASFASAVIADDRSYSPELLVNARNVLCKWKPVQKTWQVFHNLK